MGRQTSKTCRIIKLFDSSLDQCSKVILATKPIANCHAQYANTVKHKGNNSNVNLINNKINDNTTKYFLVLNSNVKGSMH